MSLLIIRQSAAWLTVPIYKVFQVASTIGRLEVTHVRQQFMIVASCWPLQQVLEYPSETTLVKAWRCQDLNDRSLPNSKRYFVAPTIVVAEPSNRLSTAKGAADRVQRLDVRCFGCFDLRRDNGPPCGWSSTSGQAHSPLFGWVGPRHSTVSFARYERSPHLGHPQTFCGFFSSPDSPRFEIPNSQYRDAWLATLCASWLLPGGNALNVFVPAPGGKLVSNQSSVKGLSGCKWFRIEGQYR